MSNVRQIAQQLTIDGDAEYVVYYETAAYIFRDYPNADDLDHPERRGRKIQT